MPAHPTKAQVLESYRRDALLQAAIRVFGESGFDCATMERIAEQADVAKGTTYLYYKSKQSIYDAALSHGLAELETATEKAIAHAPTLRDAVAAFVTVRAEYFFEHRDFFRMYVAAIARHVTSLRPKPSEFQALIDRQTRRLEQAIVWGVARREIRRVDAAAAAVAILDLTRGLVARGMISADRRPSSIDVAFLSDLVWDGLAAKGKRHRGKGKGTREKGKGKRQTRERD